ncbi:asparaginase [Streptomyces sp. RS10V-4]|uniref:asparaginase n=1 Tax=Streptomyces rhizoryzae TaxID=2932493 RepID=UPI0020044F5F|nr:asparaginase [Streptomyces rhizoryzae]MCK7625259.1 asparaginase [Streptomyces rhizoryzae]
MTAPAPRTAAPGTPGPGSPPGIPGPGTAPDAPPPVRTPAHAPVAELVRGGLVEGVHHGSVVVLAADGTVAYRRGDIEAAFYPRSALKPLQAVGLLRAGLPPLDDEALALVAASHSGEDRHLATARRILHSGGLTEDALRNVPDLPYGATERAAWLARGRVPSRLAQNCSGKHAAMLVTARTRGWRLESYLRPGHPLQGELAATVEELTGQGIARVTVDGCGAPLFAVSLLGLTRAAARLATAAPGTAEGRVADAMRRYPEMVSGRERDTARLVGAVPGLLAKDGFEGVQLAALPDGRAVGVKIADGGDRARMPVTAAALARCGVDPELLAPFAAVPVLGGGREVGALRAVDPPPAS